MMSGVPPEELAALAQASLDGMHGCIDSPRYSEPGVSCRWCHRAGTAAAAAHSNYRMMTAVRSVGCPVPHRRAPLVWACRPGWDGVGTVVATPSAPHVDEYFGQLSDRADAVLPHPSRRSPAGHARDRCRAVDRQRGIR
jgi:hypothetical protein